MCPAAIVAGKDTSAWEKVKDIMIHCTTDMQAALALLPQEDKEVKGVREFLSLVPGSYILSFHATGLQSVARKVFQSQPSVYM